VRLKRLKKFLGASSTWLLLIGSPESSVINNTCFVFEEEVCVASFSAEISLIIKQKTNYLSKDEAINLFCYLIFLF